MKPSSFARAIRKKFPKGLSLLEVQCGNGRDTYFLSKRFKAVGIDTETHPRTKRKAVFVKASWREAHFDNYEIVYARRFLQTIPRQEALAFLREPQNWLVMEVDSVRGIKSHDDPESLPWLNSALLGAILDAGYRVDYWEEAPFDGKETYAIRVIAQRYGGHGVR